MSAAGGAMMAPAGGALTANAELTQADFAAIAAIMQRDARIALSSGKTTLVQSRLAKRLRQHGITQFRDYIKLVERDATERAAMVVALTTNHTHFFREVHHFDHLRSVVLPQLKQRAAKGLPIRVWSAGCSSGEEIYTIAMCLLGPDRAAAHWLRGADIRLLATDLSPPVVEATARGRYAEATVRAIPEPYRAAWMRPDGTDHVIVDEARALVTAMVLNLFEPWPMRQKYDVIFCRNVMIYFDEVAKEELEARLVDQLGGSGHLYIGHSERLIGEAAERMRPVGQTIYARIEERP